MGAFRSREMNEQEREREMRNYLFGQPIRRLSPSSFTTPLLFARQQYNFLHKLGAGVSETKKRKKNIWLRLSQEQQKTPST
jgi:hypothetical protein